MTEVAYPILTAVEKATKTFVWDTLVETEIAALFVAVPWLGVWPLGPIIHFLLTTFSDRLYAEGRLGVDEAAIVFVNAAHKAAFDTELVKLKVIAHEKGVESDEFKKERADAREALRKFVSYGGR